MVFKLVSFKAADGNVGDDFSPWLFSRALGKAVGDDGDVLLFGVGSILSEAVYSMVRSDRIRAKVVFGSGARQPSEMPDLNEGSWTFYCVRGPLTAIAAGLPWEKVVADPAILALCLLPAPSGISADGIGIVPYFRSSDDAWKKVADLLGWTVISPKQSVEDFVGQLVSCRKVYCESMHGAIFADAYGIPWRPLSGGNAVQEGRTHAFKWTDWCSAMGVGFDPIPIRNLGSRSEGLLPQIKETIKARLIAKRLAWEDQHSRHLLSDRRGLALRQERLLELLDQLSRDYTGAPSALTV